MPAGLPFAFNQFGAGQAGLQGFDTVASSHVRRHRVPVRVSTHAPARQSHRFIPAFAGHGTIKNRRRALVDQGAFTRLIRACLGHREIQCTVMYTTLNPARFEKL